MRDEVYPNTSPDIQSHLAHNDLEPIIDIRRSAVHDADTNSYKVVNTYHYQDMYFDNIDDAYRFVESKSEVSIPFTGDSSLVTREIANLSFTFVESKLHDLFVRRDMKPMRDEERYFLTKCQRLGYIDAWDISISPDSFSEICRLRKGEFSKQISYSKF